MGPSVIFTILAILQFTGVPVDAYECCLAYDDALGNSHDAQFCDDYCCGTSSLALTCCSSVSLQAPSWDRSDYCILWWSHNVWAPILVAVANLAILVCCCYCCYRCCCARRNTTVIVQNPGQQAMMSTTVVNNTSMMTNAGYDQPRTVPMMPAAGYNPQPQMPAAGYNPQVPPPYSPESKPHHAGYDQP